jgi:Zn-dependent protease with chaperone function
MIQVYEGPSPNCAIVASALKAASIEALVVPSSEEVLEGVVAVQVPLELAQRARLVLQAIAPADVPPLAAEVGVIPADIDRSAHIANAAVRSLVVARGPDVVAALSAARARIWPPIFFLYVCMQIMYMVGRRSEGPIGSGALFPIFVLLAVVLYGRARTRLEPVERLIYREASRYQAEKRWWPPIMSIVSGLVFLAMTVVTIGESNGEWASVVLLAVSLGLIGAGVVVLIRKVRRNRPLEHDHVAAANTSATNPSL